MHRGHQHRRNFTHSRRNHLRNRFRLLQAQGLQPAHRYGRSPDLPHFASQRQPAFWSCRPNRSRTSLPPVHRTPVQGRTARANRARNPAYQPGEHGAAAEIARRGRLAAVPLYGPAPAGQHPQLALPAVDFGRARSHRSVDLSGTANGRVSARSAPVPDADRGQPDGLQCGDSDHRVDALRPVHLLPPKGSRRRGRQRARKVPGSRVGPPDLPERLPAVENEQILVQLVQRTLYPHQSDAQSARSTPTAQGHLRAAAAEGAILRYQLGRRPEVHLLGLLLSGGPPQRHRRVRQPSNRNALLSASHLGAVRPRNHAGLRRLPRAGDDRQGVHAVRHRRRRVLAGRARSHVLLGQGNGEK
uniref:(northern house mosquito) hypothetical protein n=1 Tax=Culex pipiens TaxID=7175 RepID=A0A8D8BKF1_CULPI